MDIISFLQYGGYPLSIVVGVAGAAVASNRAKRLQKDNLQTALLQVAASKESAESTHISSLNGIIETYRVELDRYKVDREDLRIDLGKKIVIQSARIAELAIEVNEQTTKITKQSSQIADFIVTVHQQQTTLVSQLEEISKLKEKVGELSKQITEMFQTISDQRIKLAGPANPNEPTVADVNKVASDVKKSKVAEVLLDKAAMEARELTLKAAREAQELTAKAAREAQILLEKAAESAKNL